MKAHEELMEDMMPFIYTIGNALGAFLQETEQGIRTYLLS